MLELTAFETALEAVVYVNEKLGLDDQGLSSAVIHHGPTMLPFGAMANALLGLSSSDVISTEAILLLLSIPVAVAMVACWRCWMF